MKISYNFAWILRGQTNSKIKCMAVINVFACVLFLFSTFLTSIVCWNIILPYFYVKGSWHLVANQVAIAFLFVNVIGHYVLCVLTDTSTRQLVSGSSNCSKLERCDKCKLQRPERAHHCKLCDVCVLKRDHHCFFMTVCIGYYNQKHFIMYCLHMTIGAFYAVILIVKYMGYEYSLKFNGPQTFFTLLYKLIQHAIVYNEIPNAFVLMLLYILYISLIMGTTCCGFFFWQLMISASGQTTYDAWRGLNSNNCGVLLNFEDVFGKMGCLLLILPLPLPQNNMKTLKTKKQ